MYALDQVDYTPEGVARIRKETGVLRDDAILEGNRHAVVVLSNVLTLLSYLENTGMYPSRQAVARAL